MLSHFVSQLTQQDSASFGRLQPKVPRWKMDSDATPITPSTPATIDNSTLFEPHQYIYGVPPLSSDDITNSLILNNLAYIFIKPGQPAFKLNEALVNFNPTMNDFKAKVNKIASQVGVKLKFKSIVGSGDNAEFVFALYGSHSFNTSINNTYGPATWEQSFTQVRPTLISEIVQASGGVNMIDENVMAMARGLNNMFYKLSTYKANEANLSPEKRAQIAAGALNMYMENNKYITQMREWAKSSRKKKQLENTVRGAINIATELFAQQLGRRFDMPDIWKDSRDSMTYTFTIELRTLTTCNDDIYTQRIIEPLIILMALASPRNFNSEDQNSYSFDSPYIVAVRMPGGIRIDHGAVTDISMSVDTNDFAMTQRPRVVRVTFTITDLYQTLPMVVDKSVAEMPALSKVVAAVKSTRNVSQKAKKALNMDSKTWTTLPAGRR